LLFVWNWVFSCKARIWARVYWSYLMTLALGFIVLGLLVSARWAIILSYWFVVLKFKLISG
jgi:hypothetical protein